MITATNPLHGKINSYLQLRALVRGSMELPRYLGEVLGVSYPYRFHEVCRSKRLVVE